MAHKAEIIGQADYGPRIRVYDDETEEEINPAEQGGEWLKAAREAELLCPNESQNLVSFMIQNGRKLDDLYGPRIETDRA